MKSVIVFVCCAIVKIYIPLNSFTIFLFFSFVCFYLFVAE